MQAFPNFNVGDALPQVQSDPRFKVVIGSTEVVKSTADGQTALMGNIGPQSIAYSLYRNMPYAPASLLPVSATITAMGSVSKMMRNASAFWPRAS